MPATENMPTPDAPFDSEIVHGGKFMLAALGRKLDSVIAYLCPTVQGRDLDSDMSDSDNRTCFVRDWDLLMRGEAITGQDPLDSTPNLAFEYSALADSVESYMILHGNKYRGTIQVLVVKEDGHTGPSELSLIKMGAHSVLLKPRWVSTVQWATFLMKQPARGSLRFSAVEERELGARSKW
ncbi:hypothetical protein FOMPIDRAFT_1017098 [Fomitopsis schrenkii]|uniref:Uncharacterized protein n=1 Tax=Fomitopsis schrenkii TaxID=2126942 RepID=S8E3J7_FOMSC|nr:hypothetical protein FOMPIDRAFT_1017098 [Fomitopsis schrenkii]